MVEQELVTGLNEITEEFIEVVKQIRTDFVREVEEAAIIGDDTFDYTAAYLRCNQKLRKSLALMKENDMLFLESMYFIK